MAKTKSSGRKKRRGIGKTPTRRSPTKRVTRAKLKITMPSRRKVIIVSSMIAVILFISLPFLMLLTYPLEDNYLHRELAYRYISDEVTGDCRSDFEKAVTLNSFMFLSEEQHAPGADVVDNSTYFDLVRHIGYCDQKAGGLFFLLDKQNIKARVIGFPCHSVAEVWIDNIPRFFDPMANCYFVYKDDRERVATLEEVLIDNDKLIMNNGGSFSEYEGKCIAKYRDCKILRDTKRRDKQGLVKTMEFYYYIGRGVFTNAFQDFLFYFMEKKGVKVVDCLGSIYSIDEWRLKEYESEAYFDLYRARSYHLFGNFQKADEIYDSLLDSKDFRDDALFFKTKILLQTKKFDELKEHISSSYDEYGEDMTSGTGGYEYLFFIERYLEKFYLTESQQLQNIFQFTEPEINEVKRIYEELFQ